MRLGSGSERPNGPEDVIEGDSEAVVLGSDAGMTLIRTYFALFFLKPDTEVVAFEKVVLLGYLLDTELGEVAFTVSPLSFRRVPASGRAGSGSRVLWHWLGSEES